MGANGNHLAQYNIARLLAPRGIVILKADGEVIDIGSALLRYLGYLASSITLGIGYLMIGFRGDKRGLHDLIGGTVVIRKTHVEKYLRQIDS